MEEARRREEEEEEFPMSKSKMEGVSPPLFFFGSYKKA
jgi:hypothetical protein